MHLVRSLGAALVAVLACTAAVTAPPADEWRPVPGGLVRGPVEHVRTIAHDAGGGSDALVHDDLLFVTTWRSFSIHDVSDPAAPVHLSTTPLPGALWNEQPQTNGRILLVSRDAQYLPPTEHARGGGVLEIYDVSDPSSPSLLSTWESRLVGTFSTHRDHLWTCVLDCTYAYSAGGSMLDLRDPAEPTFLGMWTDIARPRDGRIHHIGEIEPGIVLTGSLPMFVLDARTDPASPTVIAEFDPHTELTPGLMRNPETLPARSAWPEGLDGELLVVSMETPFYGRCDERSGDVQTFLVDDEDDDLRVTGADSFALRSNGTYTDGAPPYNVYGCSAYGLDLRPGFDDEDGGVAGVSFFEHGVRFLDVDDDGRMTERGGFVPSPGSSMALRWADEEIVYVIDNLQGIHVLRVALPPTDDA